MSKLKKWFDPSLLKFGQQINFLVFARCSGKLSSISEMVYIYKSYRASWRKVKASRKKIKGRGC